jgi:RNA polymerase sigma-70 factor (ECF subfamily)
MHLAMDRRKKQLHDLLKAQLAQVRRLLLSRGRSRPKDVDDLIQEGFLRLCKYQQEQRVAVRDPVGFLVTVAERVHIDFSRRAVLTQRIFSDRPLEETEYLDTGSTPEEVLQGEELAERIEHILSSGNPRTREIFLLHRFDGMRYAEIAERLGISTQAVTNHIAKALLMIDTELLRG